MAGYGKPVVVGWYRPEDWARIREISEDRANLPESFEMWRRRAERNLAKFAIAGAVPDKIIVDPDALLTWAAVRNVKIDQKTRGLFAVEIAKREYKAERAN